MPFRKISDLPTGAAQGGELIPATQSGTTRRLTVGREVGNIPFLATDGLQAWPNKSFFALGAYINPVNGSGGWVRIATISLTKTWQGARLIFVVDLAGSTPWVPSQITVFAWRQSTAVPPVPNVYLGLEMVANPVGVATVQDASLVETSPGVLELWVKRIGDTPAGDMVIYVMGTANTPPALDSGTVSRYAAPPSPVSGGAMVQWSTNTANRLWTGRIVRAGSDSNGSYIRFSDGTQIAQHTISSFSFGSQSGTGTFTNPYQRSVTWTYPAAFSATPVVQVTVESTASGIVVARATACSATNANIRVEYAASNAAFTANLLAIGRWY